MTARRYFIAGTDTGVGKTRVAAALLAAGRSSGLRAVGMKPVASGAEPIGGRRASADAVLLAAASGQSSDYEDLNPYCLELPISPHIAAKLAKIEIDTGKITEIAARLASEADLLLIEGAGGWYTPINETESMADLALKLQAPVVLVVGLKLGCLNHARLSLEAISRCGCRFAGWIGNRIDPDFMAAEENIDTLRRILGAQPLAMLPFSPHAHDASPHVHEALTILTRSSAARIA